MVAIGAIVAPSAFQVLEAADAHNGRVLAGLLFGDVLRQFSAVAYVCGAVVVAGLLIMKFVGPPPRAFVPRLILSVAMLANAIYAGVPVLGEIAQIQTAAAGPINALPESDPRRVRFDRLHQTSTTLMSVNLGLGFLSLFWYARE
ncbi:MAG: hypothetical protein FJW27_01380 [Acidimicrobiia bacterium]|nr:hypothetical protein [Acidimicrobiia bacterium]